MTKSGGKESSHGQVVTSIKAIMRQMLEMVTDKCIGLTGVGIVVNGRMASSMEMVQ